MPSTTALAIATPETTLPPLPRTDRSEEIFAVALANVEPGDRAALVTLVAVRGRSSRPLGAQMVVLKDGRHCGYVAGGCVEAAVAAEAQKAIASGHGRVLTLGEGSPFFDIVLPCGGSLDLLIQVFDDIAPIAQVREAMARREAVALAIDPAREQISVSYSEGETGWSGDIFVRAYEPATRLLVCGRGLETEQLVRLARGNGLDVMCVTPDPLTADLATSLGCTVHQIAGPADFSTDWIDAQSGVALLFHDLEWDTRLLRRIVHTSAFYVGALGSRTTHDRRCAALAEAGVDADAIGRIKGPIGAFGPARDAASLAASVLADVMAAR